MTSTQVSFLSFALAQQAASCTPPVAAEAAAPVVAHGLGVGSGGECTPLRARRSALVCKLRYFAPKRYRVLSFSPWGPTLYEFSSRAVAWNLAQRYHGRFVDLGAAA